MFTVSWLSEYFGVIRTFFSAFYRYNPQNDNSYTVTPSMVRG